MTAAAALPDSESIRDGKGCVFTHHPTVMMRAFILSSLCAVSSSSSLWHDASQPIDARVASLLSEMNETEKVAQTIHLTSCADAGDALFRYGAPVGACPLYGGGANYLSQRNVLAAAALNASRLRIPLSFHTESLHGACGGCVIFPMPAGQASAWDAALVRDIAATVAVEAWATGIDRGFSPELNVPSDDRFGRTEENFSQEPMLTGALGAAAVTGLHAGETGGPSAYLPPFAIVSEAKHAAAYAYGGKDGAPADISERTLHDIYLRPWREYAAAGGRGAMLAHNGINQVPCHASADLMGWLRAQAGANSTSTFAGALLASDMCDVGLLRSFRVAADLTSAAALAMGAGLDQELCNPTDGRGQAFPLVPAAIAAGALPAAALDRAVGNILRAKFAAGLFDGRALVNDTFLPLLNSPPHRALARRAAAEGVVLLKNDGALLPLAPALRRVAVVGPLAGCADETSFDCVATRSQCGGYTSWGVDVVSVLAAARNESGRIVTFTAGAEVGGDDTSGFAAALSAAAAADVVIFVGGDSGGLGWNNNTCGEDDDRALLELPGVQAQLLTALAGTGTPVVAVLIHGRPVTFAPGVLDSVRSVVAAWRPGCEGGTGLWDVLTGRSPPSGRLAQSWVRTVGHIRSEASPYYHELRGDFGEVNYNGDLIAKAGKDDGTVAWTPRFPFGFGLSYTNWTLVLVSGAVVDGAVVIVANITNIGSVASKQVVQAYYSKQLSTFVRHKLRLLSFAKTAAPVAPGATVTLTLSAPVDSLASYDPASKSRVVEAGAYDVSIGFDSVASAGTVTVNL